jgi:hypothetical protein
MRSYFVLLQELFRLCLPAEIDKLLASECAQLYDLGAANQLNYVY